MDPSHVAPPLWRQLQATAAVVLAVRQGASATTAVATVTPGLRAGVQALVFHVLRHWGRAQALRERLAARAPPPPVDALLCSALALAWSEQTAPYDVYTLVNQAVEAAKRDAVMRPQAAFINACLRRFLRQRAALVTSTDTDPVARWNHPPWWIDQLQQDWPEHWQAMLAANNRQPPMTLRVNHRRAQVPTYLQTLKEAGMQAHAVGRYGVTLAQARPVLDLPGFASGVVSVQDAAAQLAAPLLLSGLAPTGLRILDACAAPGGKTAHLLELADCQVTALDIDPARCERTAATLARLGLHARVLAADAADLPSWWDGELFDAVLLDAPCSASGVVRRHPDVRWLRRASDIPTLVATQARLLEAAWRVLKPGGRLLYCTCSVFRREGQDQIQTFLAHNTQAGLLPAPGHLIGSIGANSDSVPDNPSGEHDDFYYALLEKHPA